MSYVIFEILKINNVLRVKDLNIGQLKIFLIGTKE